MNFWPTDIFYHDDFTKFYRWPLKTLAVNDRKYVFHFRPKPKPEKHLALGRIPNTETESTNILLKFNVSNDLSN